MSRKPSYEELEERVRQLEKESREHGRAEEQMALFRRFTEASGQGLGMADLEGRVIYANPTLCRLMGEASLEDPIGKHVRTYYSQEDVPKLENEILPAVFEQGQKTAEISLLSLKGELTPTIQNVFLIRNDKGEPICLANVLTDITEQKRAERELKRHRDHLEELVAERTSDLRETNDRLQREITERERAEEALGESEARYRRIAEAVTDYVFTVRVEDRRSVETVHSPACIAVTGYGPNEYASDPDLWIRMVHSEDRMRVKDQASRVVSGKDVGSIEHRIYRKNGALRWVRSTLVPHYNREYEVVSYDGVISDITERKQAEEALRESEERFRLISEQSMMGIIVVQDDILKYVNQAVSDILEYSVDEMLNWQPREYVKIISPEDISFVTEQASKKQLGANDVMVNYLWRAVTKTGKTRWVETYSKSVHYEGRTADLVTMIDVTERKQAEEEKEKLQTQLEQAQRLESVGTLAGGIAHDFNNLLSVIQARVSLMLFHSDPTHPDYGHLKAIEQQVRSGSRLTRQLLGYARKGRYDVKPVSFNQIVEETSDTFGRARKDITIRRELAESVCAIMADQGQIEQVLLNLYVNAADAMPRGGELILKTMELTHEEMKGKLYDPRPGKYILLTVTDTGQGMDEETQKRIFEPFYTTKEIGRGTGLGLASTYGIVKSHAGYIDVDSEQGVGTTFSIYFPASEEEVEKVGMAPLEIFEGSGTILIVDDETQVLSACADVLKQLGYAVLQVDNGKEAVEIYRENKDGIDAVILDMIMPGMRGGEVYDNIKEINPDVKVLLSSGYSIDGEASAILERGCNGYIQKPFSLGELSGKIREVLCQDANPRMTVKG